MYILYRNIQTKIVPSRTLLKRLRSHNTDVRRFIGCIRKCLLTLTLIYSDLPADYGNTMSHCPLAEGQEYVHLLGTRPLFQWQYAVSLNLQRMLFKVSQAGNMLNRH